MQETIVRLKVRSTDLKPDQIAAAIGLQCDRSWCKGELREHTRIEEPDNGWVLGSGLPVSATLEEHLESLLSVLARHADSIRSLSVACCVELSCVVYSQRPPALYFDPLVVKRIANLGASLDIDLYCIQQPAIDPDATD